jgi:hypothetical protein
MTQKTTDSIIDEIHRVRREISDRFHGDVFAIAEDATRRQAASNRPVWQPSTMNKALPATVDLGKSTGDAHERQST